MLIAKNKKSHGIGEFLVKPSMLVAAELVLGKDKANMLSQIALSNVTAKGRIDELSQDIKDQLLDQIKQSPFFAIQSGYWRLFSASAFCSFLVSEHDIRKNAILPSNEKSCDISRYF